MAPPGEYGCSSIDINAEPDKPQAQRFGVLVSPVSVVKAAKGETRV